MVYRESTLCKYHIIYHLAGFVFLAIGFIFMTNQCLCKFFYKHRKTLFVFFSKAKRQPFGTYLNASQCKSVFPVLNIHYPYKKGHR